MLKSLILALLLSGAPFLPVSAQPPQQSWENLRQLDPGERIEVVDVKMKSIRGAFVACGKHEIALSRNGREMILPRAEVASVKRLGPSHRRRNVLLGLAIGAAGGLAGGAIQGKTYHEAGETTVFMAVWTPIGAGIGAAAGAVLPAKREVTVYRATTLGR